MDGLPFGLFVPRLCVRSSLFGRRSLAAAAEWPFEWQLARRLARLAANKFNENEGGDEIGAQICPCNSQGSPKEAQFPPLPSQYVLGQLSVAEARFWPSSCLEEGASQR